MFYNPEPSRGWIVEAIYDNDRRTRRTLACMQKDPEAPGESDVGIRNLIYTMVLNLRPRIVLEIGCHIGNGAVVIGSALRKNGYGKLITLEPAPHYQQIAAKYIAKSRLQSFVQIVPQYSYDPSCQEFLRQQAPFDLIFIDGAHEYDAAMADIVLSAEIMHDNGIAILHDTGRMSSEIDRSGKGGVRRALHDYVGIHPDMRSIYLEHPLWLNPCGAAILCRQILEPPVSA